VKTYRYKHTVEAMRWTDTDEKRTELATWFEQHDAVFQTRGPVIVLPEGGRAAEGDWILFSDVIIESTNGTYRARHGEFASMNDADFRESFEEMLFGQGFFNRAKLAEALEGEDPAKALLAYIRTAVDAFLADSGGPQNAVEGWEVFARWIKKHREQPDLDLTRPVEQVLQRIAVVAAENLRQNDRSEPVTELRVVEPWIDEFFMRRDKGIA
jgi:hypothetical protein